MSALLLTTLALAADCVAPPIVAAPAMGSDSAATCLGADLDMAGRVFARFPETGLSRGIELSRLRTELQWASDTASARLAILPARSGGDDGYIGIAGEAFVPVIQIAEARYDVRPLGLSLAAGLVDDIALMPGQLAWQHIPIARPLLTDRGWTVRSDMGGWASWTAPERYVTVTASITTGEGANRRERNNGVDTTVAVIGRPLGSNLVQIMAWGREGSTGLLQARNHRAGATAWLQHDYVGAGLEAALGWGLAGDGSLAPGGTSVWARTGPEVPLVGWARFDLGTDARGVDDTAEQTILVGAGPRLPFKGRAPAYIAIAYEGRAAQGNAAPIAGATGTTRSDLVFVQLSSRLRGAFALP